MQRSILVNMGSDRVANAGFWTASPPGTSLGSMSHEKRIVHCSGPETAHAFDGKGSYYG